jgi:hypothetical protein
MPATPVTSLSELKAALLQPNWAETVQAQEAWLPHLVAALPWQTRLTQHFVLHFYLDGDFAADQLFGDFLAQSERIYEELIDFFALTPQTKLERLIEAGRLIYFIVVTTSRRTFGSLTDPHLLFYLLDPQSDPAYMQRMRHELTHWVWSRRFGEAARLFQEGVAVYAELLSAPGADKAHFLSQTAFQIEEAPPLSELVLNDNFWQYDDAYRVAGRWVAYLVEQFGWSPLKALFLGSDYEDPQILAHFQAVYGQSLAAVEQQWRQAFST